MEYLYECFGLKGIYFIQMLSGFIVKYVRGTQFPSNRKGSIYEKGREYKMLFSSKGGIQIMKNDIDLSLPEYDYKQIRNLGNSYLKAAKLCDDPPISEIGWSHHLFAPIVTNYTFACELFFKSLLKYEDKIAKKHKLIELFKKLNDETQKSIIDKDNEKIFLEKLTNISDLFEKWRYVYEYPICPLKYEFLTDLAERLLIKIDNIR